LKLGEFSQIVWRSKRSWGPDVEMVLLLPVAVAVESKRTAADAFSSVGQIVSYSQSGRYDALILRLEEAPRESEELGGLLDVLSKYGVGIVVGGEAYSPLSGTEEILQKALLSLSSDPLELLKDMGFSAQSLSASLDALLSFRKYFVVRGCEL